MVVADEQSAGRGRYGRNWYSPAGEGLYVSYLLFPEWPADRAASLNEMASLAVRDTIYGIARPEAGLFLKEPNDILIGGRKVSGILSELGTVGDRISWVILGIGVNLHQRHFPPELTQSATSLALEGVSVGARSAFCEQLTEWIECYYFRLQAGQWQQVHREFVGGLGSRPEALRSK